MHLAVGSENPVKLAAVERALGREAPTVTAVDVDSGVSAQPTTLSETIEGAETRARRAYGATGAEYGVGLEGGVARLDGVPERSLITWAAVTDGDRIGRAGGPTLPLPDAVTTRLDAGAELGDVIDDLEGSDGLARDEGAIGVFTDGLTDRPTALAEAVACAFAPFVSAAYW